MKIKHIMKSWNHGSRQISKKLQETLKEGTMLLFELRDMESYLKKKRYCKETLPEEVEEKLASLKRDISEVSLRVKTLSSIEENLGFGVFTSPKSILLAFGLPTFIAISTDIPTNGSGKLAFSLILGFSASITYAASVLTDISHVNTYAKRVDECAKIIDAYKMKWKNEYI